MECRVSFAAWLFVFIRHMPSCNHSREMYKEHVCLGLTRRCQVFDCLFCCPLPPTLHIMEAKIGPARYEATAIREWVAPGKNTRARIAYLITVHQHIVRVRKFNRTQARLQTLQQFHRAVRPRTRFLLSQSLEVMVCVLFPLANQQTTIRLFRY